MKWESWWNIEGVYWDPSLHLLSAYDIKAVKRNTYAICTSKYIKNICYVKYLLFFLRFFLFLWCCCTHLIFEIWRPDIIYFARTVSFLYNWALMKAPMMHGEVLSIGGRGGAAGYNTESLTVGHSGWRLWRMSRSMHNKDIFCRFVKGVSALKQLQTTKFFVHIQISILFQ
jgi:hypothetical protein